MSSNFVNLRINCHRAVDIARALFSAGENGVEGHNIAGLNILMTLGRSMCKIGYWQDARQILEMVYKTADWIRDKTYTQGPLFGNTAWRETAEKSLRELAYLRETFPDLEWDNARLCLPESYYPEEFSRCLHCHLLYPLRELDQNTACYLCKK